MMYIFICAQERHLQVGEVVDFSGVWNSETERVQRLLAGFHLKFICCRSNSRISLQMCGNADKTLCGLCTPFAPDSTI